MKIICKINKLFIGALLLVLTAMPASALTLAGVDVAPNITQGGQKLLLNGAGVRTKFGFKVYVAALYLESNSALGYLASTSARKGRAIYNVQPESAGKKIVDANSPMAIRLYITSGLITGDKMADATLEGFEHATNGNTAPIQTEIDRLIAVFKDSIKKHDVFDLVFDPATGVNIYKNGAFKTSVKGLAFKKALFGIWLGAKPAQMKMRDGMLGKTE